MLYQISFVFIIYNLPIISTEGKFINGEYDPNDFQIDNFTTFSEDPRIRVYYNIVTEKEADYIIEKAKKLLKPSQIINKAGNNTMYYDEDLRNSSSAHFKEDYMDEILMPIRKRFASLVEVDQSFIEDLQVVHYVGGQYFKTHNDAFNDEALKSQCGNNRNHTFLVYLTTIPEELKGYTRFPNLGISVQPKRRNALYFENLRKDGTLLVSTMHDGGVLNPGKIEKFALNVWIRQRNFDESKYDCMKTDFEKMDNRSKKASEEDDIEEEKI